MKELEELERLANEATKGPRRASGGYVWIGERDCLTHGYDGVMYEVDANYTASASPDVILSLIRELKITRRALDKCCYDLGFDVELLLKRYERELYPETEQP